MDTRFWGPSGWKLFHLICTDYTYSTENAINYARFLETLPYVLPCKFCRSSLTDYYRQHPYQNGKGSIDPTLDLSKWMYTIHNCVNAKLKGQGLYTAVAPPFAQVTKKYKQLLQCPLEQQVAWDFLFAIAYHHPKERSLFSKPMPKCPKEIYTCTDICEKNKWNVLPLNDRIMWFSRFWSFLPAVLPAKVAVKWIILQKKNPPTLSNRQSVLAWLWRMRCGLDVKFADPYTSMCKHIATYSSDCGASKRGITCRRQSRHHSHCNNTIKKRI